MVKVLRNNPDKKWLRYLMYERRCCMLVGRTCFT